MNKKMAAKAWGASVLFALGGVVLFGVLHVLDRFGVPHDILAMIGIGYAFVGGLGSFVYILRLAGGFR